MTDPQYAAEFKHANGNSTSINFAMQLAPKRLAYMAIGSEIPLRNLPKNEADWPAAFAKYLREIADLVEAKNRKQLTPMKRHGKIALL